MRRTLALSLLALALASCAPSQTSTTTTVSVGLSVRFGVRVSDLITELRPDRGTGATYLVGDPINVVVGVTRPGYITLVIYDPDITQYDARLRNIPVEPGRNTIRVGIAGVPRGRSYIRAYFTPQPGGTTVVLNGRGRGSLDTQTSIYLNPYPETARDIAETYLDVR